MTISERRAFRRYHMRDSADKDYKRKIDWPLIVFAVFAFGFFVGSLAWALHQRGVL